MVKVLRMDGRAAAAAATAAAAAADAQHAAGHAAKHAAGHAAQHGARAAHAAAEAGAQAAQQVRRRVRVRQRARRGRTVRRQQRLQPHDFSQSTPAHAIGLMLGRPPGTACIRPPLLFACLLCALSSSTDTYVKAHNVPSCCHAQLHNDTIYVLCAAPCPQRALCPSSQRARTRV